MISICSLITACHGFLFYHNFQSGDIPLSLHQQGFHKKELVILYREVFLSDMRGAIFATKQSHTFKKGIASPKNGSQ